MTQTASLLNIVFAGTPDFSAQHLQALLDANLSIKAVYSQPDRPKGRGKKLLPPPTKQVALENNIPVYQPINFKSQQTIDELTALAPDVLIVVAYGLILPQSILSIPRFGCINVHASSLPHWRGAAPIERAIEAGDTETGVTIMQMDIGMDTGDMLMHTSVPISPETTGDSLRQTLATCGCSLLLKTLDALVDNDLNPIKQVDSQASYASKLLKPEAAIDWHCNAEILVRKIQAFNSANVCFTDLDGTRIRIWQAELVSQAENTQPAGEILDVNKQGVEVACGKGRLRITQVQLAGGKILSIQALLNGNKHLLTKGFHFG